MAKRRKNRKKRTKTHKKNYWNIIVLLCSVFILISGIYFNEEIKIAYYKVKASYTQYKKRYASKIEQNKINRVFKNYPNAIFGLDVSQYQGIINWQKINTLEDSTKVNFIIIRATAGSNKKDKYFTYNWREAEAKNIVKGAYHYYRPNENSTAQANNFIAKVKLKKGDIAPVLDIEKVPTTQSLDSLRKGLKNWLDLVEAHYGIAPIIYTGDSFYKDYIKNHKDFDPYLLWIANYNPKIKEPKCKNWAMWQFSDQGNATGIAEYVDLNIFDGKLKLFEQLFTLKE